MAELGRPRTNDPLVARLANLARYLCPFSRHRGAAPANCPFGHPPGGRRGNEAATHIRRLPNGICHQHLTTGHCNYGRRLARCARGLHPTAQDLDDLERFVLRVGQPIPRLGARHRLMRAQARDRLVAARDGPNQAVRDLAFEMARRIIPAPVQQDPSVLERVIDRINAPIAPPTNAPAMGRPELNAPHVGRPQIVAPELANIDIPLDPDTCSVCRQPFNGLYGLLERCEHIFCAECITTWFEANRGEPEKVCPECMAPCGRALISSSIVRDRVHKEMLFRYSNRLART